MGHGVEVLMILLLVSAAVGLAVKWVRLPYSITLVIVGLLIGASHLFPTVQMTPDVILLVCLPALLFEASWNIRLSELRRCWKPIVVLATIGVFLTMLMTAFILVHCAGLNLEVALLFGALISATDPISVLALFRKLGLDRRLSLLIEGESLFNDGTAAVLFNMILFMVLRHTALTPAGAAAEFLRVVVIGALVGTCVGFLGSRVMRYFDDHLLEITLTTVIAYGSYLIADQLHGSAVLAVVAAGIVVGNYGSRTSMSATSRLAVNSFWEYAAFVVNSLVFLLIGLQINLDRLVSHASSIGIGILAIMIARLVVIYGICPLLSTRNLPIPFRWRHLLFWGALRGSLSMALALSLPLSYDDRSQLIVLTFGVVLFTLIGPGLTIEPLVRLLRMTSEDKRLRTFQKLKGELYAEARALSELEALYKRGGVTESIFDKLRIEITSKQQELNAELEKLNLAHSFIENMQLNEVRKHLLESKKDSLLQLIREESNDPEAMEELIVDIDRKLDRLLTTERMEADVISRRTGSGIEAVALYLSSGLQLRRDLSERKTAGENALDGKANVGRQYISRAPVGVAYREADQAALENPKPPLPAPEVGS